MGFFAKLELGNQDYNQDLLTAHLIMALTIFLNATLRRYVPGYNPYEGLSLEVPAGATVARVIARLGLPPGEVTLIMVDGRRREADFTLTGDERLGLFPPIGGG